MVMTNKVETPAHEAVRAAQAELEMLQLEREQLPAQLRRPRPRPLATIGLRCP